MLVNLKQDLQKLANPQQAQLLQRFFKTGPGEYGEGDVFLGIKVPDQRKVAKKYKNLPLENIQILLSSKIHEERLVALFILTFHYQKTKNKTELINFYLKNTKHINNWDLVDLSAPRLLGDYLLNNDRKIIYKLANSKDLWEKRIAVLATFMLIKHNQYEDTLNISTILLNDQHDLIHKAVGWALREIGKKDQKVEETFLHQHYQTMPRTMLRYAIEKFPEPLRKKYLLSQI